MVQIEIGKSKLAEEKKSFLRPRCEIADRGHKEKSFPSRKQLVGPQKHPETKLVETNWLKQICSP